MRTTRYLIVLVLAASAAFSNTSFLATEFASHSIAVGKSYDLLDNRTPLSRTYTGVSALKDKTELTFMHSAFGIEDVAAENIVFAMKNPIFTGARIAGYLSYYGLGAFEVRDDRARITDRLSPYSLFAGASLIFDVRSLTLEDYTVVTNQNKEVKGRNGLKAFLSAINLGLNVNYYQSQLAPGVSAFSIFGDVNLSAKFPLPYIGMPKDLITEEYLENEKRGILAESARQFSERMRALKEMKGLNAEAMEAKSREYQSNQDASVVRTEKTYAGKKKDIARVHDARRKIYEIYYSPDVEIQESDLSNFNANTKKELLDLSLIASNAIADNYAYLRKNVGGDMRQNAEDIKNYYEKLKVSAKEGSFYDNVRRIGDLYEGFISNELVQVSQYISDESTEKSKAVIQADKRYTVKKDDTWASIAMEHYSDSNLYTNITTYNKIDLSRIKKPLPGTMIRIPPLQVKEESPVGTGGIEAYNNAKAKRYEKFLREKEGAGNALRQYRMTPVEEIYYRNIAAAYDKRIELYEARSRIVVDTRKKYDDLAKGLLEQYRTLDTTMADLEKDIAKAKLKKNLDYLQVKEQNEVKNVFLEYKKVEREIFLVLLQGIFSTKNKIIAELKKEEADKAIKQKQIIASIYQRKAEIAAVQMSVARMEAGNNEAAVKKINEDTASDKKKNEISMAEEIAAANQNYLQKLDEFDWQLYLTELTYLSSDEKKNTFAFGLYAKNLGMPVKFYEVSELLPMAFGLDLNYRFLNVENHHMTLYLHGGYSDVDNLTIGGGAMYRMLEMFEFRVGTWYEFFPARPDIGELSVAGMAGFIFDIGLMGSRVDVSVRYERNMGLTYNAGLTIFL
ncbi:MAG: hypothetical protein AABZ39_20415 [Spirochaetota bacterium]